MLLFATPIEFISSLVHKSWGNGKDISDFIEIEADGDGIS